MYLRNFQNPSSYPLLIDSMFLDQHNVSVLSLVRGMLLRVGRRLAFLTSDKVVFKIVYCDHTFFYTLNQAWNQNAEALQARSQSRWEALLGPRVARSLEIMAY
jgi:hypothetical protein